MLKKILATTGVLSAALVLASAPAFAGPNSEATAATLSVPSCVSTSLNDSGYRDYLRVYNGCSSGKRIKVVLANATDFSCYYYAPYTARDYSWNYPGRFDRLVDC